MQNNDRRGEKVQIKGKHPHAGSIGIYMGTLPTLMGMAALIKLEPDGNECFVYKSEEFEFLSKST